jgi:hypothetical protein
MSRHVFVFDITRYTGLTQSLISSAQAYSCAYKPEVEEWFAKSSQLPFLNGQKVHSVETFGARLWPAIRDRITTLATDGYTDAVFHVLSFDKVVLLSAADMSGPNLNVSTYSLTMMKGNGSTPSVSLNAVAAVVPFAATGTSSRFTVTEAIELAKKSLAARGHDCRERALYLAGLRPLLVQFDSRATKVPYDPGSVRLISDITRAGRTQGWLAVEGVAPSVRIWLQRPSVMSLPRVKRFSIKHRHLLPPSLWQRPRPLRRLNQTPADNGRLT